MLLRENSPNLYYEVSYVEQKTEPVSQKRWTLENALSAAHRFSRIVSGTARVARDDFADPSGGGLAYVAQTSLEAVPLPALRHNLLYSGRFESTYGTPTKITNNYYLNNTAQVYTGVTILASGGLSYMDQADAHQKSENLSAGVSIQPHQTVGLIYQYASTRTEQRGGGKEDTSTRSTVNSAGATYHPFETLYLVAGWIETADPLITNRLQSYGLNWSPFLGSSLQFGFTYSETMQSVDHGKTKLISPSVTWKVTRTASLTAQYEVVHTTSDISRSDSNSFSADLRAYF